MKNICNPEDLARIRARIQAMRPDSPRQWGRMTAGQALAHLADQFRLANGEVPTKDVSNWFTRTVMKRLVLWGMPAPKGKVKTAEEIDQLIGGTPPTTFEADRETLLRLIDWLVQLPEGGLLPHAHPFFGKMDKQQWGTLAHTHLDHHLRQFGV